MAVPIIPSSSAGPAREVRLADGLERALLIAPDRISTVLGDRRRTWRETYDRVARLAGALRDLGVSRGDVVAILSANSDRYFELFHALLRVGAVANPLNVRFAAPELEFCASHSRAKLIFFDAAFRPAALSLLQRCPNLRGAVAMDANDGDEPGFEALLQAATPAQDVGVGAGEPVMVAYTGGTTGAPKGVVLSAGNVYASVLSMLGAGVGRDEAAALHIAPMFHATGAISAFIWTFLGGRHIFLPKFEPTEVLRLIAEHRPYSMIAAPTMLQMLLEQPAFAEHDLSSLRLLIYGMSPMPEALLRCAMAALPEVGFLQAYGQTETAGAVSFLHPHDHAPDGPAPARLRSAGRPHPLAQVAIFRPDGGRAAAGEAGEICVRSPQVMVGYLDNPEAEAAAFRDGWLRTGDVGRLDDDGYLYVVDRLKDMIISGGENIYSAEVENALAAHPAVRMAAVIGLPDARWGERVHAVVALRADGAATAEALVEHCRELIAGYKCPRSFDLRTEDLPLTAAGKIAKADLRSAALAAASAPHPTAEGSSR